MITIELKDNSDEDKIITCLTIYKDNWKVQSFTSGYPAVFMQKIVDSFNDAYKNGKQPLVAPVGLNKKHGEKHMIYFNFLLEKIEESRNIDLGRKESMSKANNAS